MVEASWTFVGSPTPVTLFVPIAIAPVIVPPARGSFVDELGQAAASEAGWAGKDALDGIAFELKMRGFKDLAAKIQSVFDDEKNESSMRLTKMEFKGKE